MEYELSELQANAVFANPNEAIMRMDQADSEEKLIDFIGHFWECVEPARPFIRGWAIEAICDHLEAVHRGEIRRLLMNVPPGFMKSLATDVFYPAWEWGPRNQPWKRYVCASYSQDLTVRDNVRTRIVMNSPKYQTMWGVDAKDPITGEPASRFNFVDDQNAKQKFGNNHRGFKIATSVHGLGTGERGDCCIIDDPHNVLESESDAKRNSALQWFTEVMPTRTNDPKTAAFIVIMQRVHEQDVAGLILEKELGYTHLCIPMTHDPNHPHIDSKRFWRGWSGDPRTVDGELAAPERVSQEDVNELTKTMMAWGGMYAVAGQLEQRPEPRGGGMVKKAWLEIVEGLPAGTHDMCRGWDFAGTEGGDGAGSASVKTAEVQVDIGVTDLYIVDVWWDRVSPGDLYEKIAETIRLDGFDCFQYLPQDPGQAGKYQVNDLLELFRGYDFEFSLESGDKEVRFRPFAAQCETRHKIHRKVKLIKADWNDRYLDHISKFPMGRFKDIPDAQSRSYGGLVKRGGGAFLVGGSTIILQEGVFSGIN